MVPVVPPLAQSLWLPRASYVSDSCDTRHGCSVPIFGTIHSPSVDSSSRLFHKGHPITHQQQQERAATKVVSVSRAFSLCHETPQNLAPSLDTYMSVGLGNQFSDLSVVCLRHSRQLLTISYFLRIVCLLVYYLFDVVVCSCVVLLLPQVMSLLRGRTSTGRTIIASFSAYNSSRAKFFLRIVLPS
jgi:hypothetical protein